ncbi:MAG TPA: LysR family transcriptional regulator [Polyangiaceae bacterium]|nr:LysR family transcriptional regulator [Polyangiaceae bacterium]
MTAGSATAPEALLDPFTAKTFLAVAEAGSISAGARRVFRTQSTASTQIRLLEEQLGARLFDRDTRSLALTAEGERFLAYARRLLAANVEALSALRSKAPTPPLRLGFSDYFQPEHVATLVRRVSSEWPDCRFELRIGQSSALEREFEARRLDLVVSAKLERRERAGAEPVHWVARADFAAPLRGELPLVLLPATCALHQVALKALDHHGTACRVAVIASGVTGVHAALRGGLGLGCLNASAIPADLAVRRDPRLPDLPRLRFLWRARRGTLAADVAASLGAGALRVEPK